MYKVLLVDDEERVTQGLVRFAPWEETGFEVTGTATSVARALVLLESEPVDLVITDIQMPVQSGLDLIRILKEQYPKTKSIILSAYSEFTYAQEALRMGALDYLNKPINFPQMKELLLKVHHMLDEERARVVSPDIQEMLARTLLMNFANGYPYDEVRAAACIDTHCPIQVLRLVAAPPIPKNLHEKLCMAVRRTFPNSRAFAIGTQEVLAVIETPPPIDEVLDAIQLLLTEEESALFAGLSSVHHDYRGLRRAFLQAGRAAHYQSARGRTGVLLYDQVSQLFASSTEHQNEEVQNLVQLLSAPEKRSQLLHALDEALLRLTEQPDFTLRLAQQFCTGIVIEMDVPIQSFALPDYPRHARLSAVLMNIWDSTDTAEMQNYIAAYLQDVLDRLDSMDESAFSGRVIERIQAYIQEHFSENLTLNVLSDIFYISPVYLSRLFKKKTGMNFIDYLTHVRMERAQDYLAHTGQKVYHISEMVGYENPRYFARLFKDETGVTPQEYRSQAHQSPEND